MAPEDPNHPLPDQLPEDERTGNAPNPSGKAPKQPAASGLSRGTRSSQGCGGGMARRVAAMEMR